VAAQDGTKRHNEGIATEAMRAAIDDLWGRTP
jgi:hypothetical protein